MAKRKSFAQSSRTSNNSESNCSDSENEHFVDRVKRRRASSTISGKNIYRNSECNQLQEDEEHTYSRTTRFSSGSRKFSGSDSDYDKSKASDRSSSVDSLNYVQENDPYCDDYELRARPKRIPKCFTKNAVMARKNRQKKKQYLETLEGNIENLKAVNNNLNRKVEDQQLLINTLKTEVNYLRSTISNSKEIGSLLKRVCGVNEQSDFKMTSSIPCFSPELECSTNGHDLIDGDFELLDIENTLGQYNIEPVEMSQPNQGFGVCIHVANNKQVSLEFCASCNHSATITANNNDNLVK